ncbi:MAG: hypothetical protein AB1Z98_35430 [Nannocystaceae bacterium]
MNRRRAAWALVMAGTIGCARGGNAPVVGTAFDPTAASPSSDGGAGSTATCDCDSCCEVGG